MSKVIIIIDMQNDFIDGALKNPAAQDIVDPICEYLYTNVEKDDVVLLTRDTHQSNYLETQEGKKLPIPHCIEGTDGQKINIKIAEAVADVTGSCKAHYVVHDKPTFGDAKNIAAAIKGLKCFQGGSDFIPDSITLVGTCTGICVVSNALGLKAEFPEVPIRVVSDLCACLSDETHEAALTVMRTCQVEVE